VPNHTVIVKGKDSFAKICALHIVQFTYGWLKAQSDGVDVSISDGY